MQANDLRQALYAGALNLMLRHDLTGCPRSARQAADLLERLADSPAVDADTRQLCARMSERLLERPEGAA